MPAAAKRKGSRTSSAAMSPTRLPRSRPRRRRIRGSAGIDVNLAAAYLAQADFTGSRQDLSKALDAADRALGRNPALPAALFNRALALERLGDPRAPAAWQAALQAESDPAWRDEMTRRLRR